MKSNNAPPPPILRNEKRLTPDMSAANLEGLTKLCLAHAMHMYYLGKLVENTDDVQGGPPCVSVIGLWLVEGQATQEARTHRPGIVHSKVAIWVGSIQIYIFKLVTRGGVRR